MSKYKAGEIERVIKEFISEQVCLDMSSVSEDANLECDLGADSLDKIEIMMDLETAFGLDIIESHAEPLETVKDVIYFIKEEIGA